MLLAQQSLFDATRAPAGKHTGWAYCHVPNGSTVDMADRDRGADRALRPRFPRADPRPSRARRRPELERYNANYVGGDIAGGLQDLRQLFTRPVARLDPYSTPVRGVYLCSASTPPGAGVHGMCGFHAAGAALRGR